MKVTVKIKYDYALWVIEPPVLQVKCKLNADVAKHYCGQHTYQGAISFVTLNFKQLPTTVKDFTVRYAKRYTKSEILTKALQQYIWANRRKLFTPDCDTAVVDDFEINEVIVVKVEKAAKTKKK